MRINGLRPETKAVLDLLIRQIQDAIYPVPVGRLDSNKLYDRLYNVLQEWIDGNDLHPEQVKSFKTMNELQDWIHRDKGRLSH